MRLLKEGGEFASKALHLLLEWLAVLLLLGNAYLAARGEYKVLLGNLGNIDHSAKALFIGKRAIGKRLIGVSNTHNIALCAIGQFTQFAGNHSAEVASIDKQSLALLLLRLIEKPNRDRYLRSVEQLRRHSHDAIDQVSLDQLTANIALATALARQRAISKHNARLTHRCEVVDNVLNPRKVGVAIRWCAELPAHIVSELVCAPVGEVERWICQDKVRLQCWVAVVEEGIGVILSEVGLDATNSQVHLRHLPGCRVRVLTIDRDLVDIAGVALDKLCRLHKHTARAAARVIDTTCVGLQDINKGLDNAGRGVKFARQLALSLGKLREAVFVGTTEDILRVAVLVHLDIGEQIDHIAQAALVELGACKVLGQNIFQAAVLLLDGTHSVVDSRANRGRVSRSGNN